ncbi:MAG: ABC transporter permease [Geminicoccaceae bacterium]
MAATLVRRFIGLIVTLVAASLVVFAVLEILPGDPAAIMLGTGARADTIAALRAEFGFDRPLAERYLTWIAGLAHGDLGLSYTYDVPVAKLIGDRIGVSLPLALLALALAVLIGIPIGVLAAAKHGSLTDSAVMLTGQLGVAIPNFWFALILILIFAVNLGWLPAGGFSGWSAGVGEGLRSLTLPAIALALPQAAILARVTRSAVLETLSEDFVRTARAKGASRSYALWRHAVPNALVPVVTIMGLQFSFLLAGTIIVENVFYLPGIGRLVFQAISQRDLIVVKNLVLLLSATVVIVNFLVDLMQVALDPKLRS